MKDWLLKWTEREWVILILLGWMVHNLAMADKLTPQVVAIVIPIAGYVWKRTESKD